MTLRRLALASTMPALLSAGALILLGAQACSSSSDAPANPGGGACPADPFAVNGFDSVKTTKADACKRFVDALQKRAEALHCSLTPVPTCPDVLDQFEAELRAANPGLCIDAYSAGALANCECRLAAYSSCGDFNVTARRCILGVIPQPAGSTCETDAGADVGADTFDTSPLDDAPAADAADAGGGG